ncbi:interleukin-20 receptor subunit alpha isoform X12 [Hippopotamus amphibius kiboko]|uniref:interleukin-20 receptor subunit alpha isoform X12 n=1 Tax=Hippopotamus amphibius kiboko TaxID=575201 RepID=UPI00259660B5|nr:interleukin-20 receptor subunit alpha isoform X12 [Hippopotamus amphibius kiboko]
MCAPRPPAKAAARGAPAPDLPALPPLLLLLLLLLVAAPTGRAELLMQLQSVVHGAAVSTVASFWPLGWKTGLSWDAGTAETLPLHMASPYVPCVSGGLPKPTNITFLSINMKNILQWNPPQGLQGVEVTYTVQYFIRYGQKKWLNKSECRNISRTYCDLSAETSDYEHQYYAKVKAIWGTDCSKWAETGRFYPFLENQTSALKVKIIFWYILPISITVCIFSVMGYSMYRYTHVSKEKYPANLILIYGNEFDKRFFVPAEKIVINFITLSILEDSKTSQKDMSVMEKSNDVSDLNEPSEDQEPHWEEMEVKHLGYASHVVDIVCDSEKSIKGTSLTQQEPPSRTMPTDKTVIEYEYDVRTSVISLGPGDQEFNLQEEVSLQGKLFDQQTTLADLGPQTRLYSYTPQLRNLDHLPQGHVDTEEEPEEEPSITLVDWDPQTGRLCLPSLSSFEHSSEGCGHPESERLREEGLLSRLYQDQPPDKAPEKNEAYLMQFMEEWGLYVQMED